MDEDALICYEVESEESLDEGVIHAVAAVSECDPVDLPPLYDIVDPDALESLFTAVQRKKPHGDGQVRFVYNGFRVVVHSYGIIRVQHPVDEPPSNPESEE